MNDSLIEKIFKRLLDEAKISASSSYMKKEKIREKIQNIVIDAINKGEINSQEELIAWWETSEFPQFPKHVVEMSIAALKMVPFVVWKSTSQRVMQR